MSYYQKIKKQKNKADTKSSNLPNIAIAGGKSIKFHVSKRFRLTISNSGLDINEINQYFND